MSKQRIVAVSQRVDMYPERKERRDALDQRLCQWLSLEGFVPVPVPNGLMAKGDWARLQNWLTTVQIDCVVLSGGNDLGECQERDETERCLLAWAKDCKFPVLGICRGMQVMAVSAGTSLVPLTGHVRIRHKLKTSEAGFPADVNSFHNWTLKECPPNFVVTALAEDGSIEAIKHTSLHWEGWMWHPEREIDFLSRDNQRLKVLFGE